MSSSTNFEGSKYASVFNIPLTDIFVFQIEKLVLVCSAMAILLISIDAQCQVGKMQHTCYH